MTSASPTPAGRPPGHQTRPDPRVHTGARDRRIARVRHEMHHQWLSPRDYHALLKLARSEEAEAEQFLEQLATQR